MELRRLKTVRVVVSLILFVPAAFLFLDLTGVLPPWAITAFTSLQLVPSLVKLFSSVGWGALGVAAVLLLTLGFGRVYCSTLCPLGTLQDFISRLNRRRSSSRRFIFRRQNYLLQYGLLLLAGALAFGGSMLLINLTEPFSNFGRITGTLVQPLLLLSNNAASWVLGRFDVYALYNIPLRVPPVGVFVVSLAFVGMVAHLAYHHGRLYCNTLCPAGALLGLLSRAALFRIVIDEHACKECGLCEKVCKSGCIDSDNKRVDFSACVSCFNCLDACPTVGLKYAGRVRKWPTAPEMDQRRRRILRDSAAGVATLAFLPGDSLRAVLPVPTGKTRSRFPVAPPGSRSVEWFTSRCTACHICVGVCPTGVLSPSLFEYGVGGIFQPRMDYSVNPCNYDCTLCGQVCPTGAILPLAPEEKKLTQIGKTKFVKEECIVFTKKTECGACSEHCPTKAVHMVAYEKGLVIPEVNEEICIGCGACERPCPVAPNKAIYVESNPIHLIAKKPEIKKAEPEVRVEEEFPF